MVLEGGVCNRGDKSLTHRVSVSQLSRYYVQISRDGHLGHLAVTSRGHVGRRNQPRFSIEPLQFSLREGVVGKLHERRATGAPYRVATAVPRPRRPNVCVVRSGRPVSQIVCSR